MTVKKSLDDKIRIGNKVVGVGRPVFIITEAGVNHNGRLDLALKLVDAAADTGADAIKFQTFKAEQVVIAEVEMAEYQKQNMGQKDSQKNMLKKIELREEFYKPIIERCKKRRILFLSTPHGGFDSIDFLHHLGVATFKFGSGDLNNLPVLEYAARFNKPMIIATGMATIDEVKEAISCIKKAGNAKIIVLHCTTSYPCGLNEVNLGAMQTIMKETDALVGYSDHTAGILVAEVAVALGACLIEKHFTLDRNLVGPDHRASVEPSELKQMVNNIRHIPAILGSSTKKPSVNEVSLMRIIRKSVVSSKDIKKGEFFSRDNLDIKRPGIGIPPKEYANILGRKSTRDIEKDSLIMLGDYV